MYERPSLQPPQYPMPPVMPRDEDEPEAPLVTAHHALQLLPSMEPMLRAFFRDLEGAQRRVMIECFIVRDDRLGRELAAGLRRAAARGARVQLLYDPLGCEKTDPCYFDDLTRAGVEVRAYRPRKVIVKTLSYGPRDHGRILVLDDAAYASGMAFGDEWLPEARGGHGWHDVSLRMVGQCVENFVRGFDQRWREAVGEEVEDVCHHDDCEDVTLVADSTVGTSEVYRMHCEAVRRARSRIWLENAYFFPPVPMLRELSDAARRGVDVKVIVPGVSDSPLVRRAARGEYAQWLELGLELYEYQRVVAHSKFGLIDDDWCTIGSFNANPAGIGWTNETNVFVYDPRFVARVAGAFEHDLARSRRVTAADVRAQPFGERLGDQLRGDFLALLDLVRGGTR